MLQSALSWYDDRINNKIKVEVKEDFNRISDDIISYAYSDIDPNAATGVLLLLETV